MHYPLAKKSWLQEIIDFCQAIKTFEVTQKSLSYTTTVELIHVVWQVIIYSELSYPGLDLIYLGIILSLVIFSTFPRAHSYGNWLSYRGRGKPSITVNPRARIDFVGDSALVLVCRLPVTSFYMPTEATADLTRRSLRPRTPSMLATGTQTLALAASMPSTLELAENIMYTKIEYTWTTAIQRCRARRHVLFYIWKVTTTRAEMKKV